MNLLNVTLPESGVIQLKDSSGNLTVLADIVDKQLHLLAPEPKAVTGTFITADDAGKITDSSQTAYCYYLGNRIWSVRLYGKFTAVSDSSYFAFGINIEALAAALGQSNAAHVISGTSYGSTYRIWDYSTGAEKTALYGYWASLNCLNVRYLRFGRCYSIADGVHKHGGWPLSSMPASSYVLADFYAKMW